MLWIVYLIAFITKLLVKQSTQANENYIVKLKVIANHEQHHEWVDNEIKSLHFHSRKGNVLHLEEHDYHVYSLKTGKALFSKLLNHDDIETIELDQTVHLNYKTIGIRVQTNQRNANLRIKLVKETKASNEKAKEIAMQKNAPWNLAMLNDNQQGIYRYPKSINGSEPVIVFLMDTGVNENHRDLSPSKVIDHINFVNELHEATDDNGHGTHIAGIICGNEYGVAKDAKIIDVKVLNKDGTAQITQILKALSWISKKKQEMLSTKVAHSFIINMSFGCLQSRSLNALIEKIIAIDKVSVVAAAGNSNDDACFYSPSSAKGIISVGSIDETKKFSLFSNYGKCVDINAPGENIISCGNKSNDSFSMLSGTSFAAPHVTGLIALHLQNVKNITNIKSIIKSQAIQNEINELRGETPNLLAHLIA